MLLEEICCTEEICCRRRYADGGDMLPEEIWSWTDMLLEGICYWMGYVAGEDAMLKKLSSQRRYLAKGGI